MSKLFLLLLRIAYGLVTAIGLVGYVPTVNELLRGGTCANRNSYLIWTSTSIISVTYVVVITGDLLLIIAASFNLFFCSLIYALTFKRVQKFFVKVFSM